MNDEIKGAIDNLEAVLRKNSSDKTISFTVFVNCEGREVKIDERTHNKANSFAMRNLKGDFVK